MAGHGNKFISACTFFLMIAWSISQVSAAAGSGNVGPRKFELIEGRGDYVAQMDFRFKVSRFDCVLSGRGEGRCVRDGESWLFELPVDEGLITGLYVAPGDHPVLAYGLTDDETVWSRILQLRMGEHKPGWSRTLSVLNMDAPILSGDMVVIGGAQLVMAISATTGDVIWQHQWLYDPSMGEIAELSVENDIVKVKVRRAGFKNHASACFSRITGWLRDCPAR